MTTVLVKMCVTGASSVKFDVPTLISYNSLYCIETVVLGTVIPRDFIVVTTVLEIA